MQRHLELEQLEPREMLDASAFANTAAKIGIISDELNTGLSQQLIKFIATHTDGTQKETAAYNQEFRNYNPQWALLYYKLATTAGPVPYIIDNQWTSDWNYVNAHESWFMHNASGQRLYNAGSEWYQMDPTNTAWQQYWLSQVSANLQESGAQGVFADTFEAGIGPGWYEEYDARFAGTNAANPSAWPGGYTWIDQLQNWANIMQAGLNKIPGAPLFIPNIDGMNTEWNTLNYAELPAAFAEGFGDYGPTYLGGLTSDWVLAMNRALEITDQNKVFIIQSYLQNNPNSPPGLMQRGFDLGSYLLLKSAHTYINVVAPGHGLGAGYYYPEDQINLGSALAPPATNVSQYLWDNVYRRDFQNGIVLVNPSHSTYTFTLPQTYALVSFQGGGQLLNPNTFDSAGNYIAGDLSTTPVTTLTLTSGQTAILMNPSLLPASPTGLTASTSSSSQINLSWKAVTGARAYWVEQSTDGTIWNVLDTTSGSTTAYTATGLSPGTKYYYRVVAGNTIGNSGYSNTASTNTQGTATGTASLVRVDTLTQGNWIGMYGTQGYNVIDDASSYPSYLQVSASGNSNYVWSTTTTDPRALQNANGTGRTAATWFSNSSFTADFNFTDGKVHQLALYLLDWDKYRSEGVDIIDTSTGAVISSQLAYNFQQGEYLVWDVSGNIEVRITSESEPNAVLSGFFIDPVASTISTATASFVKTDTTAQGNWKGVYGGQGYNIIDNASSYPRYAQVTPSGNRNYIWSTTTTDSRALLDATTAGRTAACWFSDSSFMIYLDLTDDQTHQLALYLLDWDDNGRLEQIQILDARTGQVLSTETASSFSSGEYLVWNVSGDVVIRITNLDRNSNAALSGLFLDPAST